METLAKSYRLKAIHYQSLRDEKAKAEVRVSAAFDSWQVIDHFLASGLHHAAAIDATSAQTGFPPETIIHHWERALNARKNDTAEGRALDAVRMAARGWTNSQIAKELGIHPNSVSRIISKALRRNQTR